MTDSKIIAVRQTPADAKRSQNALADILCWLDGYRAGGGSITNLDIQGLRELKADLEEEMEKAGL